MTDSEQLIKVLEAKSRMYNDPPKTTGDWLIKSADILCSSRTITEEGHQVLLKESLEKYGGIWEKLG